MLAPIIELAIIMVCFALPERRVSRFNIFSTTSKCARYFLGNNIVLHANRFSILFKTYSKLPETIIAAATFPDKNE